MGIILITKEEIVEDNEVTIWYIDKDNGAILININKILDETITDCNWIGRDNKFLSVEYTDWDNNELIAILNDRGEIIKRGLEEIELFIEEKELFIAIFSGYGLGDDACYYNLGIDECKMSVLNYFGKFIIDPIYDEIHFNEEEFCFYAKNYSGVELKFTLNGEILN